MTNVPLPSFGPTGFTSPPELEILAGVLADLNDAFGGALNPGLSTPQGQLATSEAAIIGAFNDLFVQYVNQVDPAFSQGRMQDAIARIYFITRRGATPTVVACNCTGLQGVTIPVGALAVAVDGTIYSSLTTGTIGISGTISLQFAALVDGPIACPAGTLNKIYRSIPGWDSITNPGDGTPGRDEETAEQLEARRVLSVAQNATGILPAIRGVVLDVPTVVDAYVTENDTGSPVTTGGVTLAAHSLYVCVEGGSDVDVATAIWLRKPPGCAYTGTTTVTIEDTNSGYLTPPTYDVTFQRADPLTMDFAVTLVDGPDVPGNVNDLVSGAISAVFPTLAKIGQTMYASSYVCAIGALGSWVRLESITINSGASQSVQIDQFPMLGAVAVTLS